MYIILKAVTLSLNHFSRNKIMHKISDIYRRHYIYIISRTFYLRRRAI